jgi:ADP-ribosyl-[dinitrogen reductase] hydrolase
VDSREFAPEVDAVPSPGPPAADLLERRLSSWTGAFLGLACGDALGAPAEFLSPAELDARHGRLTEMVGGGTLGWRPGEWTDDTAMALCVARGILERPDDPVEPIGERFLAWARTARDVGGTVCAALAARRGHDDWFAAARSIPAARTGHNAGNGSLMRTLPVALAYRERALLLRQSARISAMTHWHPVAESCCAVHCLWVRELLAGSGLADGWRTALATARGLAGERPGGEGTPGMVGADHSLWQRLEDAPALPRTRVQPTGYAGYALDCLEAAAWACLGAASYEDAVVELVNLGGEADTMAAVAGAAAGAFHGAGAIPARWLEALHARDEIAGLARQLARLGAGP